MTMGAQNDKVYTPDHIAVEVLDMFMPLIGVACTILEPFKGGGAFYRLLPKERTSWCEIDEGVDFLSHREKHDWIITNPPYSTFDSMLQMMLQCADNLLLVIPMNKLLSSMPRLMELSRNGFGIERIHYLGSGRQLNFPFGFPVGAVLIRRAYVGGVQITYADRCLKSKTKRQPAKLGGSDNG